MSDTNDHLSKDLEDKENARRKAMGLPPLPPEAWKPHLAKKPLPAPIQRDARKSFADYSMTDVEENIREHREMNKEKYSGEKLERYMESYKVGLLRRVEAAIIAKSGELKPSDSLVVSDEKELKTVPVKEVQDVLQEQTQEPAKLDQSIRDTMQAASGRGVLKDRFPSITKLVNMFVTKQGDDKKENVRQTEQLRKQVERNEKVGFALEALLREQKITVKLLRELLDVVKQRRSGSEPSGVGAGGSAGGNLPSLSSVVYGGLALGAAAGIGAGMLRDSGVLTNPQETDAAAAAPDGADVDAMGLRPPAPTDRMENAGRESEEAETEEQIYNRLLAETPENIRDDVDVQNDLRSEAALIFQRNRQQTTTTTDGVAPPPSAAPRISSGQPSRITGPRPALVLGEGGDLAAAFPGAGDAGSTSRDQQVPTPGATQVSRPAASGTGQPVSEDTRRNAATATQERSVPEGATPVRLNGQVVGYMPEGGGPTVTFDDAGSQGLESARSQTRSQQPAAAIVQNQLQTAVTPMSVDTVTPIQQPTASSGQDRSVPEGATPIRVNGELTGYMPEGGGPTVAFDDAGRQGLESVRSQLTTPVSPAENLITRTASVGQQNQPKDVSSPAIKVQEKNLPKSREAVVNEAVTKQEILSKELENSPDMFSNRTLMIRARNIKFKGDEIEFQQAYATPQKVGGQAPTGSMSGGGGSPLAQMFSGGGSATAGAAGGGAAMEGGGAGGAATTADAEAIKDLKFAPGVDKRIKEDIAQKVKETESASGKSLTITSGFRDPARNAAAGGARNSAHTSGKAVDIQFRGSVEDTVNLIQKASASGVGGIGVYRPGFVHLDTGPKRAWGPDYTARSIPDWAKESLQAHMTGQSAPAQASGGGESGGGDATMVSSDSASSSAAPAGDAGGGSAPPAASPEPSAPASGMAVTQASVQNEVAARTSEPPTTTEVPADAGGATSSLQNPSYSHSMNDPGPVEPADAAQRYAMLFNMAA